MDKRKPSSILIIGLGNPLREDDGIGVHILDELRRIYTFSDKIIFIEGRLFGISTLTLWQNFDNVIIIDALEMGKEGGEFIWEDFFSLSFKDTPISSLSIHQPRVKEIITLAYKLNYLPKKCWILGVQPLALGYKEELSPVLKEKLPEILEFLKKKINLLSL